MFLMVAGATHLAAHADHADDDGVCVACQISAAAAVKIAPDIPASIEPVTTSAALPLDVASVALPQTPRNNRSRGPPALSRSV